MLNIRRYQWWKNKITPTVKRIVLSAAVFTIVSTSLAFHAPLYNSELSVAFEVLHKDGKSFCPYPKEESKEIKEFKRKKYIFLAGVVGHTNAGRSGSFKITDYTYTGLSLFIDDGVINNKKSFRIKFLTSGTFTSSKKVVIDCFLVGGGGGGRSLANACQSGGGGGYTGTYTNITLNANQAYSIVIGGGGAVNAGGGTTTGFGYSKSGGYSGNSGTYTWDGVRGGYGGSGGGSSGDYSGSVAKPGGAGGSNGSNGYTYTGVLDSSTGQGTTTREFGDASGDLYSGGGGGGAYNNTQPGGNGGSGGGGRGGGSTGATTATANSGGGGGGGIRNGGGTAGGSGILIIRNTRS